MRIKIRIKSTGQIDYCYDVMAKDGTYEKNGIKLNKFTHTYFKDEGHTIPLGLDESEFDVIPWEPYELFGIECDKGWHPLLKPIFDYIEEYNKDKDDEHKMQICQIKEKWAELCVYLNFYTDDVDKLIQKAEEEAANTCELCGNKNNVGVSYGGWYVTKCHDCVKKWCVEHNAPIRWHRNSDNKMYWVYPDKEDELIKDEELP